MPEEKQLSEFPAQVIETMPVNAELEGAGNLISTEMSHTETLQNEVKSTLNC